MALPSRMRAERADQRASSSKRRTNICSRHAKWRDATDCISDTERANGKVRQSRATPRTCVRFARGGQRAAATSEQGWKKFRSERTPHEDGTKGHFCVLMT
ncbi:unnamed protein product [Lampetra planeri]